MKKFASLFTAFLALIIFATPLSASEQEFKDSVSEMLSEAETGDIADGLDELGISPESPESVKNVTPGSALGFIKRLFISSLSGPFGMILTVTLFAAICAAAQTLSFRAGICGELFVLICFISIAPASVEVFRSAISAVRGADMFMLSYVPVFASVAAASGNLAAAVSYNAIVLYFCEAAALVASKILSPILCAMLVLSAAQALDSDLMGITAALKRILTTLTGFIMTVFLGIIGLQTVVGHGTEGIALKAGKYAVSSFVPVIGYSLSESYRAVSLSLSAIRTAAGGFGIAALCIFMLSPIISALVYKTAFIISAWICRLAGAERLGSLMYGLSDVYSFLSTVLIFFMLMLTVSTGMLILLGGAMLT